MATPAPLVRRRLAPEERRSLILDHTAEIVARDGVAQLSIEGIGRAAGVSKSLVYAYFPNLTALLSDLYGREMRRLRKQQMQAAETANKAGVKLLVLYHLLPAPDNFMLSRIFTRGLDDARQGDWDLADDGSLYTLPVGSAEVRIGHVPQ